MPNQQQWGYLNGPQGTNPQNVPAPADPMAPTPPADWGGWTPTQSNAGVNSLPAWNGMTTQQQIDHANVARTAASNPGAPGAGTGNGLPGATVAPPMPSFQGMAPPDQQTTPDPYMLPTLSQQILNGLQQPTATSQFYGQHQGDLNGTGPASQYWSGVAGQFNGPRGTSNDAETAFQDMQRDRPNLEATPGLGGYYADAEARASANLNKQFAAQGAYGGSVSQGTVGSAIGGLEADRAKNEANYALARQNAITNFDVGASGAGRAADTSALGNSQNNLSYLLGGGTLASNASQDQISRLLAGAGLAGTADQANLSRLEAEANVGGTVDAQRLARENSQISNLLGFGNQVNNTVGGAYGDLTENDKTLLNDIQGGKISESQASAEAQQAVQQGNYNLAALIMKGIGLNKQPTAGGAPASA